MKKAISFRRFAPLIIIAILAISIAVLALIYISQSNRALESKPLVLIHSPLNRDPFLAGEWVSVSATARSDIGLRSVELWVNNAFVDLQSVPEDGLTNSLTFSSSWLAKAAGNNVLIVRAIDADGSEGQASIIVEVSEPEGELTGTVTARQGDTLRSIAGEYGLDPDLLQLANPGLDPDDLDPGGDIIIPDTEEPPAETGPPIDDPPADDPPADDPPTDDPPIDDPPADDPPPDDPPPLEGDPPGSGFPGLGIVDDLFIGPFRDLLLVPAQDYLSGLLGIERAADQARLQLELINYIVRSISGIPEGQINLYFNYGGPGFSETVRMPLVWAEDVAPMQIIDWPRARDLPISFTLVIVTEDGTNSLEMYFEEEIPPEFWNGISISSEGVSDCGDHSFELIYSISQLLEDIGFEAYVDRTITPPENVHIDFRRQSLRWDYNPRPDEEPIEGFRIYLNGSLQWVEPASSRESRLPNEWLNPPCNMPYGISVTAYRSGIPSGPESLPGFEMVFPDDENCQFEIRITFIELETFDLGPDCRNPPYHGDVGPVYGEFFANEEKITFDTNAGRSWRRGSLDLPDGLRHNRRYNLAELVADTGWSFTNSSPYHEEGTFPDGIQYSFSSYNSLIVQIPDDGSFQFGFRIIDEDYGRDDQLLADAQSPIYNLSPGDLFDPPGDDPFIWPREGVLVADNGRCQVRYALNLYYGGFIMGPEIEVDFGDFGEQN